MIAKLLNKILLYLMFMEKNMKKRQTNLKNWDVLKVQRMFLETIFVTLLKVINHLNS